MTKTQKALKSLEEKNIRPNGFYINKREIRIGDKKRDTLTYFQMQVKNASCAMNSADLKLYLGEYNRVTKEMKFRNAKNQMVVVKMGPSFVDEYMNSQAYTNYTQLLVGNLFRPQLGIM